MCVCVSDWCLMCVLVYVFATNLSPESNLYQVFMSILALILNEHPYYNEPGFEKEMGSDQGKLRAKQFNEAVRLLVYRFGSDEKIAIMDGSIITM